MIRLLLPLLIVALLVPAGEAVAQNDPIEAIATLRAYARAALPPASKAGRLARVVDESNVVYVDDGASWRPLGEFVGPRLVVAGADLSKEATSAGVVGIGTRVPGVGLNLDVPLSSSGTVHGARIRPHLYPGRTTTGGDGVAFRITPTVHISPGATGKKVGGPALHKWVTSAWIDLPVLKRTNDTIGAQDVVGLRIGNSDPTGDDGLTLKDVMRGLWAIRIQGGLPSEITGSIFLDSAGTTPLMNIRVGDSYHANALRIATRLAPLVDSARNASGEGFGIRSGVSFNTHTSGRHVNLGNTSILTPTVAAAGGASVVNFTTLKVGDAPAAVGSAVVRALWVGTGLSEIEGVLGMGTKMTSGAADGDIVLKNNTGAIRGVNAAGSGAVALLRLDNGNLLKIGEGVIVVDYGQRVSQLAERKDPAAPPADNAYVYAKDNGHGKTQLCARFAGGGVHCFATEP